MTSKIDLLLHPIRLRVIMALSGKSLTPGQIAVEIPDVPLTSLYRHIHALMEGGILSVVEERPVRGTVEKVYRLVDGATRMKSEDMENVSSEDHLRYFMVFLSSLLQDFSSYLEKQQDTTTLMQDVVYSKVAVYLSNEQFQTLSDQTRSLIMPYTSIPDHTDYKRYIFALLSIPED